MNQTKSPPRENTLLSLALNIILPVIILRKLGHHLGEQGPLIALILALSLPMAYGAYIFWQQRKFSWMAAFGLLSVFSSGIFAVLHLTGDWFILKEGLFPLLLGLGVLASALTRNPLFKAMFFQEGVFHVSLIETRIQDLGRSKDLVQLFRWCTILFSGSFLLSSLLNFWLAARIFTPVDPSLPDGQKSQLLNTQIAEMTWQSQLVIVLPLMVVSIAILVYFLMKLGRLSEMKWEEMLAGGSRTSGT